MCRSFLILALILLSSCVYLPLPNSGPNLQTISLPAPGVSSPEVRQRFGTPDLLDTPEYLLYEWTAQRRFVIVPAIPTGVPVGGIFARERTRLLLKLDAHGLVAQTECSVSSLSSQQLRALDCLDPITPEGNVKQLFSRQLNDLPELKNASFYDGTMSGSNLSIALSPDGRFLGAVDTRFRVWLIDLENFRVAYAHQGRIPRFWEALNRPRVAFSNDSQLLVISQPQTPILVLRRSGGNFAEMARLSLFATSHDVQFTESGDSLIGFGQERVQQTSLNGTLLASSAVEGSITNEKKGPISRKTAEAAPLLSAVLDTAWHKPSQRAVFTVSGQGLAILDPRNDFARQNGSANFRFSPRGNWLAENNCRYLALWNSHQLAELLVGVQPDSDLSPDLVMVFPLTERDNNSRGECLGPLSFSPDGSLIAAATRFFIYLWRISPGEQPTRSAPTTIPLFQTFPGNMDQVLRVQLTADQRLVVVTARYSDIRVQSWQLSQP